MRLDAERIFSSFAEVIQTDSGKSGWRALYRMIEFPLSGTPSQREKWLKGTWFT